MAKNAFDKISYHLTPDIVDRVVRLRRHDRNPERPRLVGGDGAGLLGIDSRKRDVFFASDVPELSSVFARLLNDGMKIQDLAVVVKIPKDVRKARAALMTPE